MELLKVTPEQLVQLLADIAEVADEGKPLQSVVRGPTMIADVNNGGQPGVEQGFDASMPERLDFVLKYPRRIDLLTAAYLRVQVQELDGVYDRTPATALLGQANRLHGRITFLRDHAPVGRVRRDLLAAVTESATLVGQLVWDASQRRDHTASVAYFDQAIESAQLVRDDVAESNGWLRKSFVALYGKRDPRIGLGLAERAADGAAGVSHVISGLARLHMAEAHAMLGETTSCEAMLARAETALSQADEDDAAAELGSPTHISRLAGSCYLFLGRPRIAQRHLEAATPQQRPPTKANAVALGNLALAYVRQALVDQAVAALHEAIDVVEATRGGGGLNIVFTVGRELRPWSGDPPVAEVLDRLLALMSST
jgi:hypothetical protein